MQQQPFYERNNFTKQITILFAGCELIYLYDYLTSEISFEYDFV